MAIVLAVMTAWKFDMPAWWWALWVGMLMSELTWLAVKRWPMVLLHREYERLAVINAQNERLLSDEGVSFTPYKPVSTWS